MNLQNNCHFDKLWFLTNSQDEALLRFLHEEIQAYLPVVILKKIDENIMSQLSHKDLLVSYATSHIVSAAVFKQIGGAYNIHAASPTYPGRDPHHFAIYYGETLYGATAHVMEERVDSGAIVDVEYFDVPEKITPDILLQMADNAAITLIKRFLPRAICQSFPLPSKDIVWGTKKTTRKDFQALCEIPLNISEAELKRRIKALTTEQHSNLKITLHGCVFKLER